MRLNTLWSWLGGPQRPSVGRAQRQKRPGPARFTPALNTLEDRTVLNGYLAIGAGVGAAPLVTIRIDRVNSLSSFPNDPNAFPAPSGQPNPPATDGHTDTTTQTFLAYDRNFRGGVRVATGNFDGFVDQFRRDPVTGAVIAGRDGLDDNPDYLVTAAGPGGGPHIKIFKMREDRFGYIFIERQVGAFMAFDPRFRGGVNITTGDLDGDGKAELIIGAGRGGGPHVKIYKFDTATGVATMVHEFMAYDPTVLGGVSVSSGQGYQVRMQVRQEISANHPNGFVETPYPATQGVPKPGAAQGFPLSGTLAILNPDGTITIHGTFTVGSGGIQYVGANLLNNYGNLSYTPNVEDQIPPTFDDFPSELPLTYATWSATSANRPAFMPAGVPIGPFIRLPDAGNTPVVQPLSQGPGAVNFRNQLVTGPGPGSAPVVRVWDFVNDTSGFHLNDRIEFNAFDPSDRGGISVAIGSVVQLGTASGPNVLPNRTVPLLQNVTFPLTTDHYNQYSAQIIVTSSTGKMRVFADTVETDFQGRVTQKTRLSQLNLRPVLIDSTNEFDPTNPLNGFMGVVSQTSFTGAIDPQFRGQVLAAVSALQFNGTAATSRAQYVFGAGQGVNIANRGPRIRIFDNLGTLAPTGLPILNNTTPGNQDPHTPLDDFLAFTIGSFPGGVGGMAFGFGQLPMPTTDVLTLPARAVASVSDPIYVPPTP
jgi:FG-GAP repeat